MANTIAADERRHDLQPEDAELDDRGQDLQQLPLAVEVHLERLDVVAEPVVGLDAVVMDDEEGHERQDAGDRDAGRRRTHERDHAEQVHRGDEHEQRPKERQEPLVVVLPDRRDRHLVADEQQERLDEVGQPSLGYVAARDPPGDAG